MKEEIKLREYKKGDEHSIIETYNQIFPKKINLEYWKWKYLKVPSKPVIIVALNEKNEVIGHYANQFNQGTYNEKIYPFGSTEDIFVRKDYRKQGILGLLIKKSLSLEPKKYISKGFPLKHTINYYKKYNIPFKIQKINVFVKNISIIDKIAKKIKSDLQRKKEPVNIRSEEITNRDEQKINSLWGQKKNKIQASFVRNWNYLKWRILDCPIPIKLYLIKEKKKVVGYFALNIKNKTAHIVDILILNNKLKPSIIKEIERRCIEEKANKIKIMISDESLQKLLKRNYYKCKETKNLGYYNRIDNKEIDFNTTYSDTDLF